MQKNNNKEKLEIVINNESLSSCDKLKYYYVKGSTQITNIVVLVHGISRNANEIIKSFSKHMAQDTLLIAPVFSKEYATDYQRLGRKNKGPRADYILQAIVNELSSQHKVKVNKINLFGFSAGAQFVHRYAFAHPAHVNKVAIVAAGWYTMPDVRENYPYGLKLRNEFTDINFEKMRFLRVKFRVYVGEKDYLRDKSLNKNTRIDKIQGQNRLERAENWTYKMNQCLKEASIKNRVSLEILENVSHDFGLADNLGQICGKVSQWFKQD